VLSQVALVYDEPDPPVLLALAEEPEHEMADLLVAAIDRLPATLYAHVTPSLLAGIQPVLVAVNEPVRTPKLGLVRPELLDDNDREAVDPLGPAELEEVERFYARAYPRTWFQARMLETGRYVGIRRAASSSASRRTRAGRRRGASRPRKRRDGARGARTPDWPPPPAHGSAGSSSTTGSTRSRSTSAPTTTPRSAPTRSSASRTPPTTSRSCLPPG
jgi:hypothetical protein